jgi:hypothetical protein
MPSPDLSRLRLSAFRIDSFRIDDLTARMAITEIARQNYDFYTLPRFRFRNQTRRRMCRLSLLNTITVRRFSSTVFRPFHFPKEACLPFILGLGSFELPSLVFTNFSPKSRFPCLKNKTSEFPRTPFDALSPCGVGCLSSIPRSLLFSCPNR